MIRLLLISKLRFTDLASPFNFSQAQTTYILCAYHLPLSHIIQKGQHHHFSIKETGITITSADQRCHNLVVTRTKIMLITIIIAMHVLCYSTETNLGSGG